MAIWTVAEKVSEDLVDQLLHNRGVAADDRAAFMAPDYATGTHDPFLFTRMEEAARRVFEALRNKERIVIHGDYDADGVCGASVLYLALLEIRDRIPLDGPFEGLIEVFLPDREEDGYGIAEHTIRRFGEEKRDLVITVDCGISNADELDLAGELGMDVIVCDHHQLGERLPEKAMLIHPLVPGEDYPNKTLCGTGVAFKLVSGVFEIARREGIDFVVGHEKWYLDFVAVATVTDVMPLVGENRVLEKYGLVVLNKTQRPGLLEILRTAKVEPGGIDTQTIGFQIGPRLNAAGRLGSAKMAFLTLVAEDHEEAAVHADALDEINKERRRISDSMFRQARNIVKAREDQKSVTVVWDHDWKPGVVGIIAGKLVREFGAPAFVLTRSGDHFVGSGRSMGGMHLVEAMRSCGDIFMKAGGHPQACGLSIADEDQLRLFADRVDAFGREYFGEIGPVDELLIDAEVRVQDLGWDLHGDVMSLAPFGQGNRLPKFLVRGVQVVESRKIGATERHLKMAIRDDVGSRLEMIGFGFGSRYDEAKPGAVLDMVMELDVNEWNGRRSLQGRIIDFR